MKNVAVSIVVGSRSYTELISIEEERREWEEHYADNEEPLPPEEEWVEWIREINISNDELKSVCGNHLLFGFLESLWQSDRSPHFCLTEYNDAPMRFIVVHTGE